MEVSPSSSRDEIPWLLAWSPPPPSVRMPPRNLHRLSSILVDHAVIQRPLPRVFRSYLWCIGIFLQVIMSGLGVRIGFLLQRLTLLACNEIFSNKLFSCTPILGYVIMQTFDQPGHSCFRCRWGKYVLADEGTVPKLSSIRRQARGLHHRANVRKEGSRSLTEEWLNLHCLTRDWREVTLSLTTIWFEN